MNLQFLGLEIVLDLSISITACKTDLGTAKA